ncbi:MAG: hypothetical protein O7A63_09180, partial [Acidobacteria bacterium]|nr:hypothetical protein [Acidobacteriota bacterium]
MTAGASRLSPIRTKIFLLLAGPLLVAIGIGLGGFSPGTGGPDQQVLDSRAASVRETFLEILGQATEVARIALEQTPEAAWAAAHTLPGQFGSRIEGVGVLGPDLRYLAWEGSPAEPPASSSSADGYDWEIRVEGVRTRLVARVGPDDEQRVGLASFVVDSTLGDSTFARLFPTGLEAGVQIDFVLFDTESLPDARPLDPRRLSGGQVARTLESPGGDVLGVAYLTRLPAERRTERLHDLGRAWAVLIFLILLGVLFNWKTICSRSWGLPGVLAVLLLSRFSLVWEEIPTRLLPRSLGGPSLFGSSGLWDLLASPADLFLTAGTVFLICVACRTSWGSRAHTHPRAVDLLATIAAVSATVLVLALTVTLARDSRIPLLERPGPFQWDGRMLLWAGLFLTLLGAAELWAVLWSLRIGRRDAGSARPVPIAVALTLLAVGSSAVLQQQSVRLAVEQLGSDFAPEVLEQGSRRRITLMAALGAIRHQAVEFDLGGDRET